MGITAFGVASVEDVLAGVVPRPGAVGPVASAKVLTDYTPVGGGSAFLHGSVAPDRQRDRENQVSKRDSRGVAGLG
jgi:hypothetical protein